MDNCWFIIPRKGLCIMANINTKKGVIGILTGGGDVPGLNPAIRGVTTRALHEGYQVIGFRRGWAGLVEMVREKDYDNSDNFLVLTQDVVDRAAHRRHVPSFVAHESRACQQVRRSGSSER